MEKNLYNIKTVSYQLSTGMKLLNITVPNLHNYYRGSAWICIRFSLRVDRNLKGLNHHQKRKSSAADF